MSRGPVDKKQLAAQIIQSAKAAGIEHFVLDFDGTVLANHFFYNKEYGKKFYDQDPVFEESNAAYKTKLKDGITQEQAKGIFADFELFNAILNEAFRNKVTIHIASKQSYSAIASVLKKADISEKLITGGIHGNPYIDGLKSSPSDPKGNGGDKIRYIASLVEQGIDSSSIFYADDAELFGKEAIEDKKANLRKRGVKEGDLERNAELIQLRKDVELIKDVTTFGCMNTEEMLPLTQHVVASRLEAGRIEGNRIVGAGLDQSKWEMINAKFVEKVISVKVPAATAELSTALDAFNIKQVELKEEIKGLESKKSEAEENLKRANEARETAEANTKKAKKGVGGFFRSIGERIGIKTNISKFTEQANKFTKEADDLEVNIKATTSAIADSKKAISEADESVKQKLEKLFELAEVVKPKDQGAQYNFVKDKLGEGFESLPGAAKKFMNEKEPKYATVNRAAKAAARAAAAPAARQAWGGELGGESVTDGQAAPVVVRPGELLYDTVEEPPIMEEGPVVRPVESPYVNSAEARAAAAQEAAAQSLAPSAREGSSPAAENIYGNQTIISERSLKNLINAVSPPKVKPLKLEESMYINLPGVPSGESTIDDEGYGGSFEQLNGMQRSQVVPGKSNTAINKDLEYKIFTFESGGEQKLGEQQLLDVVFSTTTNEFLGVRERGADVSRDKEGFKTAPLISPDSPECARLLGAATKAATEKAATEARATPGGTPRSPSGSVIPASLVVGAERS